MRSRVRPAVVGAALCGSLLVACGGDGAPDADTGGSSVAIRDLTFAPSQIEIAAGGEVVWTNEDSVEHTVTFQDGADSGNLASGATFERAFPEPGDYGYACAIHPSMTGAVTVSG